MSRKCRVTSCFGSRFITYKNVLLQVESVAIPTAMVVMFCLDASGDADGGKGSAIYKKGSGEKPVEGTPGVEAEAEMVKLNDTQLAAEDANNVSYVHTITDSVCI